MRNLLQEQHEAANEELQAFPARKSQSAQRGIAKASTKNLENIPKKNSNPTNEELTTVNEEMANRNHGSLIALNNDLSNLSCPASIQPSCCWDADLTHFGRFTPLGRKSFLTCCRRTWAVSLSGVRPQS